MHTQQQGPSRADIDARIRESVERARESQARALQAAADMQASAQAAAQAGRLQVPPPPKTIRVQDGKVIVEQGDGTREIVVDGPPGDVIASTGSHGLRVNGNDIPPGAQQVIYMFFVTLAVIAIGIPLARAFGRWLDRRGHVPAVPADVTARLDRIEQAVETVAVEVERISEGQRFSSKLLAELRQLPQLEAARADALEPRR